MQLAYSRISLAALLIGLWNLGNPVWADTILTISMKWPGGAATGKVYVSNGQLRTEQPGLELLADQTTGKLTMLDVLDHTYTSTTIPSGFLYSGGGMPTQVKSLSKSAASVQYLGHECYKYHIVEYLGISNPTVKVFDVLAAKDIDTPDALTVSIAYGLCTAQSRIKGMPLLVTTYQNVDGKQYPLPVLTVTAIANGPAPPGEFSIPSEYNEAKD